MTMKLRLPTINFVPLAKGYAARPESLSGLRVGFLDGWGDQKTDSGIGMYPAMAEIERILIDQYGVEETLWQLKPKHSKEVPADVLKEFADRVDVVVNGEGLCGSCTAASVLDAVHLEDLGRPTITIVGDHFQMAAELHCRAAGLPDLPLLIEPAPHEGSAPHDVGGLVADNIDAVVRALSTGAGVGGGRRSA
jgi:hypothetical protein